MKLSPQDDYRGALDIRIHPGYGKLMPSADFLLIDPTGKKAGAVSEKTFSEFVAGFADYEGLEDDETGESGPSSGVIDISNPAEGGYVLRITGTEDGRFSIELNGYNKQPKRSHAEILDAPIKKGEVVECDVEVWPTCIVLPKGYRLALSVRGTDYVYPGEPGAGVETLGKVWTGVGPFTHDDPRDRPPAVFGGDVTLHAGSGQQPYVLLPVIPKK